MWFLIVWVLFLLAWFKTYTSKTFFFLLWIILIVIGILKMVYKKAEQRENEVIKEENKEKIEKMFSEIEEETKRLIDQYKNWDFEFLSESRLDEWEKCYGWFYAYTTKTKKKTHGWGYLTSSFKIIGSLRYRSVEKVNDYSETYEEVDNEGTLYLTNKKILFWWDKKTKTYKIKDIMLTSVNLTADWGDVKISKKSWTVDYYKVTDPVWFASVLKLRNYVIDEDKEK